MPLPLKNLNKKRINCRYAGSKKNAIKMPAKKTPAE
jgi:hypothetical protein